MNVVFVGNVDAGKSTLCGQIILPSLEERVINEAKKIAKENKKESFWLAYLLDTDDFERIKGITVNYNKYPTTFGYNIIDCPGHSDFVQHMIQGATMCDTAVLVVSCKNNEYERSLKGQTTEHALLVYTLGITKLIVAVNKMDPDWDSKRYTHVVEDMSKLLKNIGFKVKKEVTFIPISAYEGTGVHTPNPITNISLNELILSMKTENENENEKKIDSLLINGVENLDDSNKKKISCRIYFGESQEDGNEFLINTLNNNTEKIILDNLNIKGNYLTFETLKDLHVYDILSKKECIYSTFLVQCFIIDSIIITKGYSSNIHINGIHSEFEVIEIYSSEFFSKEKSINDFKKEDIKKLKKVTFAKKNEKVLMKLTTKDKIPILDSTERIIMRNSSKTIAIGKILLKK